MPEKIETSVGTPAAAPKGAKTETSIEDRISPKRKPTDVAIAEPLPKSRDKKPETANEDEEAAGGNKNADIETAADDKVKPKKGTEVAVNDSKPKDLTNDGKVGKAAITQRRPVQRPYKLKPDPKPAAKTVSAAEEKSNLEQVEMGLKTGLDGRWSIEDLLKSSQIEKVHDDFEFPGEWQPYYDRNGRHDLVVIRMKNKGFPDWDEVFEKAAERLGVSADDIRNYGDGNFWDELFWEEVRHTVESFDSTLGPVVVAGRSGGYWGFEIGYDWFRINTDRAVDLIKKRTGYYALVKEAAAAATLEGGDFDADKAADYVLEKFVGSDELVDSVDLDLGVEMALEEAQNGFKEIADDFETPDRWVDIIEANNYYNKDESEEEENEGPGEKPSKGQRMSDAIDHIFDN